MRRILAVAPWPRPWWPCRRSPPAQGGGVSGLLVRVQGDVVVGAGESADLVLVVSGDADVRGRAAAVVVVGGTARLTGARVGHLVVMRGAPELERGTVVEGDVWLTWAGLDQAPGARVEGAVHRGVARFGWGWLAVSPLLSVGLAVLGGGGGPAGGGPGPAAPEAGRRRPHRRLLGGAHLGPGAVRRGARRWRCWPSSPWSACPPRWWCSGCCCRVLVLAGFAVAGLRLGTVGAALPSGAALRGGRPGQRPAAGGRLGPGGRPDPGAARRGPGRRAPWPAPSGGQARPGGDGGGRGGGAAAPGRLPAGADPGRRAADGAAARLDPERRSQTPAGGF